MNMNTSSQTAQPHDANCLREIARMYIAKNPDLCTSNKRDRLEVTRKELSGFSDEVIGPLVSLELIDQFANLDLDPRMTCEEYEAALKLNRAWKYKLTPKGLRQAAQDALDLASELMDAALAATAASEYGAGYQDGEDEAFEDDDDDDADMDGGDSAAPSEAEVAARAAAAEAAAAALTPQTAPRDAAALMHYTPYQLRCFAEEHLAAVRTEEQKMAWFALRTNEARAAHTLELLERWDAKTPRPVTAMHDQPPQPAGGPAEATTAGSGEKAK
jgi:hypothetical protein